MKNDVQKESLIIRIKRLFNVGSVYNKELLSDVKPVHKMKASYENDVHSQDMDMETLIAVFKGISKRSGYAQRIHVKFVSKRG